MMMVFAMILLDFNFIRAVVFVPSRRCKSLFTDRHKLVAPSNGPTKPIGLPTLKL